MTWNKLAALFITFEPFRHPTHLTTRTTTHTHHTHTHTHTHTHNNMLLRHAADYCTHTPTQRTHTQGLPTAKLSSSQVSAHHILMTLLSQKSHLPFLNSLYKKWLKGWLLSQKCPSVTILCARGRLFSFALCAIYIRCICICTHMCNIYHARMYVCVCVRACVCVCAHTHTHTQAAMGQTKRITTFGAVCGVTVRSSPCSFFFLPFPFSWSLCVLSHTPL